MSTRPALPGLPPDEAASRQRIRRYAVPRWMIAQAAERRLAGDWRGACAAANVDVLLDPGTVAAEYGEAVAAALADDLRHLAPDLLRWHLPRILGGRTTLATGRTVVLAAYGGPEQDPEQEQDQGQDLAQGAPRLHVVTPPMVDGPQRLALRLGPVDAGDGPAAEDWTTARHLWDARRSDGLRGRCGGGDRVPFFHSDGAPLTAAELPTADPGGGDPAAAAEWITLLHGRGEVEAACAAAGMVLDPAVPEPRPRYWVELPELLGRLPLDLPRLGSEMRLLAEAGVGERFQIAYEWPVSLLLERTGDGTLRASAVEYRHARGVPALPEAFWRRLPDLDLLRTGRLAPEHLHPLVRTALFPRSGTAQAPSGPPDPEPPVPVRVRCRGEWHEVASGDGALRMPHSAEEQQRERAMRAFGGAVAGCFAVQQAWTTGSGRLPRGLHSQRRELFLRVQHGDTPGVLRLLDAGVDPRVRDGGRRTLLHRLHLLDHEQLLPRLLAAGVGVDALDHHARTPLHTAVGRLGSEAMVRALLAAGARIDTVDDEGLSLADLVARYKRHDLAFLRERVEETHPDLGVGWWSDEDEED